MQYAFDVYMKIKWYFSFLTIFLVSISRLRYNVKTIYFKAFFFILTDLQQPTHEFLKNSSESTVSQWIWVISMHIFVWNDLKTEWICKLCTRFFVLKCDLMWEQIKRLSLQKWHVSKSNKVEGNRRKSVIIISLHQRLILGHINKVSTSINIRSVYL